MTILPYSPDDHGEIIARWWTAHTGRPFQHTLLPPVGLVGSDELGPCCAVWLYMSVGVGVAFIECPVSRPGMGLKQSRDAFVTLIAALEAVALSHDYGVLTCNTLLGIRRTLKNVGFTFDDTPKFTGTKLLR